MTAHWFMGSLLLVAVACGPESGTESDAESTTSGTSSSGGMESSGASAEGSVPTTGEAQSTGADDTGSDGTGGDDSGVDDSAILGTWQCMGFEDPIYVWIQEYEADPPVIAGLGCGPGTMVGSNPFRSDNCDELMLHPGLGPIQFQFDLPYPEVPDFGPVGIEFIGGYDPATDTLIGIMWVSTLGGTVDGLCERIQV